MISRIVRSRAFVPVILIFAALIYWRVHQSPPKALSIGFIGERDIILWNTLAQVRESVGEVHYGDRVEVVRVEGTAAQVRTASGTLGWIRDSRQIMDSDLWDKSGALLKRASTLPIQARGRTKTVSNLRVAPGRDGQRIFQLARGTRVLILERAVADAPQGPEENSQAPSDKSSTADDEKPKQEDWLLVLRAIDSQTTADAGGTPGAPTATKAATGDAVSAGPVASQSSLLAVGGLAGPVAGWVLARFVEMDLPGPVKDLAGTADMRVIAWFELNRVDDGSGGEAPQYLAAGSRGGEGSACDFTMLRVYTWGKVRKRYETAYVESDLCGRLPILVSNGEKGPEFQFPDVNEGGADRKYVMIQTAVRRVRDASARPARHRN
jgi:hypothetical protein